jgi:hypothetical protein
MSEKTEQEKRKMPPSPVLAADAPPMPGGSVAVTAPREFKTRFDLDGARQQVRQMAQASQQQVSNALRNLHQTTVSLRQQVASLSEEQRKLWTEMQDVPGLGEIEGAAGAFEQLVEQFTV